MLGDLDLGQHWARQTTGTRLVTYNYCLLKMASIWARSVEFWSIPWPQLNPQLHRILQLKTLKSGAPDQTFRTKRLAMLSPNFDTFNPGPNHLLRWVNLKLIRSTPGDNGQFHWAPSDKVWRKWTWKMGMCSKTMESNMSNTNFHGYVEGLERWQRTQSHQIHNISLGFSCDYKFVEKGFASDFVRQRTPRRLARIGPKRGDIWEYPRTG